MKKALMKTGIEEIKLTDIVIPSLAVIEYLKSINFNRKIFIFGTHLMKQDFINEGFTVSDSKVCIILLWTGEKNSLTIKF